MRWLPKKLRDHLEARAAEIEKTIDAPSVDPEKIDAAIAEMVSARKARVEPESEPERAPTPAAAPRTGFGRRGL